MNRIDVVSRIRIGIEMENCWWLVGNSWLPVSHEARKVVVLCEAVAPRPGDQDCEVPPQRRSVDLFEFPLKIDATVPDFEGRKFPRANICSRYAATASAAKPRACFFGMLAASAATATLAT